jgi:CHAT domain-containing protein/tetratricopeptide (TPR) repeat protein
MKTSFRWIILLTLLGIALCSQSPEPSPRTGGAPNPAAAALRAKAESFNEAGEPDSALVYAREGAALAEKGQNLPEWGKCKVQESLALYYLNEFRQAVALLPPLESRAKNAIPPDDDFWGAFYNCAGIVYHVLGDFETALNYGLREIAFYEKKDEKKSLLADACYNISISYRNRGDFDRSIEYAQSALQIFLSGSPVDEASVALCYNNLSQVYYRKKDYRQAIACSQKALTVLQRDYPGKDPFDAVIAYNDLANACTESGEYERALEAMQTALKIYAQHPKLVKDIEVSWHNMGFIYRRMGKYAEAKRYILLALERNREVYGDKHPNIGKAYRHLGFIANKEGKPLDALRYYQQALLMLTDSFPHENLLANPSAQKVNAYQDFLLTLRDKGETLRQLARQNRNPQYFEAALATFDAAVGLLDTMRAEYQEGSRLFWNREARPIVEGAISAALDMHRIGGQSAHLQQAFAYAEKSKALLLADALRESAARQKAGIPQSLLQEEKDLKIDIAFYKKQIFREQQRAKADSAKILHWQKEIFNRRRSYELLLEKLETSYPEYYRIKYNQPPPGVAAIRQALPDGTGLLEYFSGDSSLFVFYIDREGLKASELSAGPGIEGQLDSFIRPMRDRSLVLEQGRSKEATAHFAGSAATLYRALVAPVLDKAPAQKLIVIPDGSLSYLPFELLLTRGANADDTYATLPYLLRSTAVRYEYSASIAFQPRQAHSPERLFSGYAPAYETGGLMTTRGENSGCREFNVSDFAALDNNQSEVSQIAASLDGKALLGHQATESNFRQFAPGSRILHLAMHGFLNDCDPLYSGLAFSSQAARDSVAEDSDGILHAYEIYNLHLDADLAVLSACNTGRGQLAKGEGVISLARAFKYAGCANVLMSLWQADDRATAQIMQTFYRYLKQGMGKDAAVRQAKLDYLGADSRNHPFFWGAFVLIGDDAPVPTSGAWPVRWLWLLLPLSLLAWWYFFRRSKIRPADH